MRDLFSRLGRRLTYANVMATLALFVALGGGAYAATQLKKEQHRHQAAEERRGHRGEAGPKGDTGPKGDAGTPGTPPRNAPTSATSRPKAMR
jgi:hypothetical protein